MSTPLLRVGDLVRVDRAVLANPAGTGAIVVEVYDRGDQDHGYTLLFPNGNFDGFSPGDLLVCRVAAIGPWPALAPYVFRSAVQLESDYRRGVFDNAFATLAGFAGSAGDPRRL